MKLYVIRHGEVDINVNCLINARNDSYLNERGIKQAKEAGNIIKNKHIDFIICSPLKRTKETCEYINVNKVQVKYDDRLMERDSRSLMYKPISILDKSIWYDITQDIIYGDNEGFKSVFTRIKDFLNSIVVEYKDKDLLIVTHGDVCKAINAVINNITDYKEIDKLHQDNCEIVTYEL